MFEVPNSAPDSLTPRKRRPVPLVAADVVVEEAAAAAEVVEEAAVVSAELVVATTAAAVVAVVAAVVATMVEVAEVAEVADVLATGLALATTTLDGDELPAGLLLQVRFLWTAGAARADAVKPATSKEEEKRIMKERGGF